MKSIKFIACLMAVLFTINSYSKDIDLQPQDVKPKLKGNELVNIAQKTCKIYGRHTGYGKELEAKKEGLLFSFFKKVHEKDDKWSKSRAFETRMMISMKHANVIAASFNNGLKQKIAYLKKYGEELDESLLEQPPDISAVCESYLMVTYEKFIL